MRRRCPSLTLISPPQFRSPCCTICPIPKCKTQCCERRGEFCGLEESSSAAIACKSLFIRVIHLGDTLVPVDPDTFGARLEAAGFEAVEVQKNSRAFRFHARRPVQ